MATSEILFNHYLDQVLNLRQGNNTAPHKPLLLLSILDVMNELQIHNNQIPIDENLFKHFNRNWKLLAKEYSGYNVDISQPLHYMQNDQLGWELIDPKGQIVAKHIRSKRSLKKEVAYGHFDEDFFQLLWKANNLDFFRWAIIEHYFGDRSTTNVVEDCKPASLRELDYQLTYEPEPIYQKQRVNKEISRFYRHHGFKVKVRRIYSFTCCMSGWKIETQPSIIEACHIQDHAHTGIDTLNNGLALCPNLHRAFDNGLISLTDNYTILVAGKTFFTEHEHDYALNKLKGKRIGLPQDKRFAPSPIFLEWHRSEKFEKR